MPVCARGSSEAWERTGHRRRLGQCHEHWTDGVLECFGAEPTGVYKKGLARIATVCYWQSRSLYPPLDNRANRNSKNGAFTNIGFRLKACRLEFLEALGGGGGFGLPTNPHRWEGGVQGRQVYDGVPLRETKHWTNNFLCFWAEGGATPRTVVEQCLRILWGSDALGEEGGNSDWGKGFL